MRTILLAGASALAITTAAAPDTASAHTAPIAAQAAEQPAASPDEMFAKRGRSGTGLRGRDRDRNDDNPSGDDGTPDQGPGNDDDGPETPNMPGDDDGTPDQGKGDVARAFLGDAPAFATPVLAADDGLKLAKQGRGRGRGRGGDRDRDDDRGRDRDDDHHDDRGRGGRDDRARDRGEDESGSGRRKPRIPGGSGCDDPGDVAEHAACR